MTKAPTPTEMSKGQSDNTNNATKKFDETAIADRLRTVSWSNYSHLTVCACKMVTTQMQITVSDVQTSDKHFTCGNGREEANTSFYVLSKAHTCRCIPNLK